MDSQVFLNLTLGRFLKTPWAGRFTISFKFKKALLSPKFEFEFNCPYSRHAAPGPECGRVFKPHARFSRFMGRLAKIFDPNLRIYFLLEDEPRLRYRPSLLLNLPIALILSGPSRFQFLIEISILFH
jgi:hypothetical protein